jgi:hypothetical protein
MAEHYKTEKQVIDDACGLMFGLMDTFYKKFPDVDKAALAPHINTVYINLGKELYFHRQKTTQQKWGE